MSEELKPLPPDLAALLDGERRAAPPPAEVRERVRARLWATLGLAGATGAAAGSASAATSTGATTSLGAAPLAKIVLLAIGVAGVGTGITLGVLATRKPPAVTAPAAVTTPTVERVKPSANENVNAGVPASAQPAAPARRVRPVTRAAANEDAERELLESARREMSTHPQAALDQILTHGRTWPNGQLTEERESLRILALARLGRDAEARARLERFRARWPSSLFLPGLEQTVR
jgi:hypothetical protein